MSSPANKMEEKKKPKTRKLAETNSSSWSNVFWLSAFLLLEAAALISVVTWQQHALDELTTHIDTETRVSRELDRACQNSHDNWDGGPPHQNEQHRQPPPPPLQRRKRQELSGLFAELLEVQKHVLIDLCQRRTDLCQKGPKGEQGQKGADGDPGRVGIKGDTGVRGPAGDAGLQGPQGEPGIPGQPGPRGPKGVLGHQGLQGSKGVIGDKGDKGDPGHVGLDGGQGQRGAKGDRGPTGPQGQPGPSGAQGPKGTRGAAGPQGDPGERGSPGQKGSILEHDCHCGDLVSIFGNFSDTMTVVPYQSLTLHCEVSDLSTSVTWRKSNGQLPAGVLLSGNNIIFTSVSADNVGVYQCVANTSVGVVTKDVSIKVREASRRDCDFQYGFCLWTNVRTDKFDWTRQAGPTSSPATGPTADHTRGDPSGYYAYIETSAPRLQGDFAQLESDTLSPGQDYCLNFWYHTFGTSIGNITVKIEKNGRSGSPIFTTDGVSDDVWRQAKVNIPAQTTPFSLIIEGVRGGSYTSDLAIDDIVVLESECP